MKKILIFVGSLFIISCGSKEEDPTTPEQNANCTFVGIETGECPSGDMTTLIWQDEFDEDGAPASHWFHETVPPNNGNWWNNEQQHYTNRRGNSIVENGNLKIIAKREDYQGKDYTSARMITKDRFEFQYGRVEIRAKLPVGQGTWPALWLLGENIDEVSWPRCGEIDIMEHGDGEPGLVSSSLHQANANGDDYVQRGEQVIQNEDTEFHVYRMDWTEDYLEFFVDGRRHHYVGIDQNTPFHQPFFLIFNVAMGGNFVGNSIDPDFVSSEMVVDYIRVYQ